MRAVKILKSKQSVFALICLSFVVLCAPVGAILAQEEYTVHLAQVQTTDYPNIDLYIEVRDASGNIVTDLQPDDIMVTEDGKSAKIVDFAGVEQERPVDIVFVFDTTGSMRQEVDAVTETCIKFAQELEAKGRNYRLGLITFWDDVREVYGPGGDLTDDAQNFKAWIEDVEIIPGSGDDVPENDFGALKRGSQLSFRSDTQRIFILITDAPPHYYGDDPDSDVEFDDPDLDPDRILDILAEQTITVYAVADNHSDFRRLARETGGQFYDIAEEPDFTGIIEEIGIAIASQYRVTYQSPRPNYDGTRRDIKVSVGDAISEGGEYLEQHLLNIRSDPQVGLLLLLPLLLMLVVPALIYRLGRRRAVSSTQVPPAPAEAYVPPGPPPPAEAGVSVGRPHPADGAPPSMPRGIGRETSSNRFTCAYCGHALRSNAKFCPGCGRPIEPPSLPPSPSSSYCPNCGSLLREGAKFCNKCGASLSGGLR